MESKPLTAETEELNCKELVELVTEYLEGAMSSAEMRRFEEHLGASFFTGNAVFFDIAVDVLNRDCHTVP